MKNLMIGLLAVCMLGCFSNAFAGLTGAFVDIAIDNNGNAIAIFNKMSDEGEDIERIAIVVYKNNNKSVMSEFIYPVYNGIKTKVFVVPKGMAKSKFSVITYTFNGRVDYVPVTATNNSYVNAEKELKVPLEDTCRVVTCGVHLSSVVTVFVQRKEFDPVSSVSIPERNSGNICEKGYTYSCGFDEPPTIALKRHIDGRK